MQACRSASVSANAQDVMADAQMANANAVRWNIGFPLVAGYSWVAVRRNPGRWWTGHRAPVDESENSLAFAWLRVERPVRAAVTGSIWAPAWPGMHQCLPLRPGSTCFPP